MHLANCHFGKLSDTPSIIAVHFIIWMATTVKWSSTWCVIITITSRYENISAIHVFMFIVMIIILHHHFYMHKNVYLFNFFHLFPLEQEWWKFLHECTVKIRKNENYCVVILIMIIIITLIMIIVLVILWLLYACSFVNFACKMFWKLFC